VQLVGNKYTFKYLLYGKCII